MDDNKPITPIAYEVPTISLLMSLILWIIFHVTPMKSQGILTMKGLLQNNGKNIKLHDPFGD